MANPNPSNLYYSSLDRTARQDFAYQSQRQNNTTKLPLIEDVFSNKKMAQSSLDNEDARIEFSKNFNKKQNDSGPGSFSNQLPKPQPLFLTQEMMNQLNYSEQYDSDEDGLSPLPEKLGAYSSFEDESEPGSENSESFDWNTASDSDNEPGSANSDSFAYTTSSMQSKK